LDGQVGSHAGILTAAAPCDFQFNDRFSIWSFVIITPLAAFTTGFGWLVVSPKQWAFVFTVVAVIFTANLNPTQSLVNYFIFSVLIQVFYLLIIGIHLLMPRRSGAILDTLFNWIKHNFRPVVIVIFTGFGLFFLFKRISELIT
jgi:threonine/homoserine/homoserine lactone efflux protein